MRVVSMPLRPACARSAASSCEEPDAGWFRGPRPMRARARWSRDCARDAPSGVRRGTRSSTQIMSLNSAVGADGGEMGRAQALQAQAAVSSPRATMNPVLAEAQQRYRYAGHRSWARRGRAWRRRVSRLQAYRRERCSPPTSAGADYELMLVEGAGSPRRSTCAPVILPTWGSRRRSTARWCWSRTSTRGGRVRASGLAPLAH